MKILIYNERGQFLFIFEIQKVFGVFDKKVKLLIIFDLFFFVRLIKLISPRTKGNMNKNFYKHNIRFQSESEKDTDQGVWKINESFSSIKDPFLRTLCIYQKWDI